MNLGVKLTNILLLFIIIDEYRQNIGIHTGKNIVTCTFISSRVEQGVPSDRAGNYTLNDGNNRKAGSEGSRQNHLMFSFYERYRMYEND